MGDRCSLGGTVEQSLACGHREFVRHFVMVSAHLPAGNGLFRSTDDASWSDAYGDSGEPLPHLSTRNDNPPMGFTLANTPLTVLRRDSPHSK